MRILVITRNAWDDTNAIGNTLSNFFQGVDNVEFAAIYFRSAMPNNKLCNRYFQTSEIEILRKWFSPSQIGKQVFLSKDAKHDNRMKKATKEKKIVRIVQKYGVKLAYKISDYLWYSEKWINDNLDQFIESFSPDLMVTFVKSAPQYYLTVKYLREKYNIPLFSWIADDEYTGLLKNNSRREIQNLKYILSESAVVKGCSEELCLYYNSLFGCCAGPLYKSCDLSVPVKEKANHPITIVYAGNLLYGRLDIICRVANVIEELSSAGLSVAFEIYSNTALLPSEEQKYFKTKRSVKYMGKKEYVYIKERLSFADLVLHVESFEEDQIIKTKYSFSTKIIDCLQSGSVLLAIGPQEIASMNYIQKVPGTLVIDNLDDLSMGLKSLLKDEAQFHQRALEMRSYAQQHHSVLIASNNMMQIINKITTKGE